MWSGWRCAAGIHPASPQRHPCSCLQELHPPRCGEDAREIAPSVIIAHLHTHLRATQGHPVRRGTLSSRWWSSEGPANGGSSLATHRHSPGSQLGPARRLTSGKWGQIPAARLDRDVNRPKRRPPPFAARRQLHARCGPGGCGPLSRPISHVFRSADSLASEQKVRDRPACVRGASHPPESLATAPLVCGSASQRMPGQGGHDQVRGQMAARMAGLGCGGSPVYSSSRRHVTEA